MFAVLYFGFMVAVLAVACIVVAYALRGARARKRPAVVLPAKRMSRTVRATVLRDVSDADIERELREGRVLSAIRLYQEQTGAGAVEAKAAVDAWRQRLRAS